MKYTRAFKEGVLEWMRTTGSRSYEAAEHFGVKSSTVRTWRLRLHPDYVPPHRKGRRKPHVCVSYDTRIEWASRIAAGLATPDDAAEALGVTPQAAKYWVKHRHRLADTGATKRAKEAAKEAAKKAKTEARDARLRAFFDAAPKCPNCGKPAYHKPMKQHYMPQVYATYCGKACYLAYTRFPPRAYRFVYRATLRHARFDAKLLKARANFRRGVRFIGWALKYRHKSPLNAALKYYLSKARRRAKYAANPEIERAAKRRVYAESEETRKGDRRRGAIRRFGPEWGEAFVATLELRDAIQQQQELHNLEDRQ